MANRTDGCSSTPSSTRFGAQDARSNFDILDVPRDRFLCAGEAWFSCRSGADPAKFGIDHTGVRGLWFVAGDLIRDVAALNKAEMLP